MPLNLIQALTRWANLLLVIGLLLLLAVKFLSGLILWINTWFAPPAMMIWLGICAFLLIFDMLLEVIKSKRDLKEQLNAS